MTGIPLLRGRTFTERDTSTSARVMMINEAFAKKFFPGADPIGKHITYSTDRITCEVVGVTGDVRSSMQEPAASEELYLPLSQRPWLVAKLLVRTNNPAEIAAAIRSRIQAADPSQAVAGSVLLEQVVSALLLAAVGIYGVMAYSVAQRRKEIGIRMALGADTYRIKVMVFRQTFRLLAIGLTLGLPLAMMLNRLYTSLLFDVKTWRSNNLRVRNRRFFGSIERLG